MGSAAGFIPQAVLGISGLMGGNSANRRANEAQDSQNRLIDRQVQAFDALQNVIKQMEGAGAFDPQGRVDQARKDAGDFEERDLKNTAGAYKIAGYRAGDTPMQSALDTTRVNYKLGFDRTVGDIRRGAIFDRLGAYQGLNSGSGSLNAGISSYGNQVAQAQSQNQGMSGFLNSLMPFLGGIGGKKGGASTGVINNADASSGGTGQTQVSAAGAYAPQPTPLGGFKPPKNLPKFKFTYAG